MIDDMLESGRPDAEGIPGAVVLGTRATFREAVKRGARCAALIIVALAAALPLGGSVTAENPIEASNRLLAACNAACGKIRDDANAANCAKGGLNCYDDVYGCVANICFFGYDQVYVAAPAYLGCIDSAFATYHGRLREINATYLAAGKTFDAKDARHQQGKAADATVTDAILACKAAACDPACRAAGKASGTWHPRNPPVWESCECVAAPREAPAAPGQSSEQPAGSDGTEDDTAEDSDSKPSAPSCRAPVHAFRMRLDYAFSIGEILGYTRICYIIQELDGDDVPGRKSRICFQGGGITAGSPVNYSVSPNRTEWTRVETRGGPLCLEDLSEVNGYHTSAGAIAWGGGGFFIGDRKDPWNKRIESKSTGAQIGFYAGIDWMWGRWKLVDPITV